MKLVEIKECLENQVWYDEKNEDLYCIDVELRTKKEREQSFSFKINLGHKLVGFIGINYNLNEYGELVEIPREEFEVGDIVEYSKNRTAVITKIKINNKYGFGLLTISKLNTIYRDSSLYPIKFKKIGIYGVTHTFINNKLEE